MRNATQQLLRVSLTMGAITAALVCAELSRPRATAPRSVAMERSDPIVRVRSIAVDRVVTEPDAGQRTRIVSTVELATRDVLALAQ
jgi:hypothetical protein